jgi:hypothetical protein
MPHGVATVLLKAASDWFGRNVVAELGEDRDVSVAAKKSSRQPFGSAATTVTDVQRMMRHSRVELHDCAIQSSAMLRSSSRAMVSRWPGNCSSKSGSSLMFITKPLVE